MKLSHLRQESGFSLIELMVASVVTMIVLGSAVALTSQIQNGYRRQIENSAGEQEARYAMEWIGRHLRSAGNNPYNEATANVCPGSTNFLAINIDPNEDGVNDDITIQSDINPPDKRIGGVSPNCTQTGEHITISFDAPNNTIVFRDEAVPGAGTARTDNVIGGLEFFFLDANRDPTADESNIFYVQTRITIRSRTLNATAGAADTRVLTSEVRVRNR